MSVASEDPTLAPVVRLRAWREAARAATFLRGCLHQPTWLKEVIVELAERGEPRVVVMLLWQTTLIRRCLPTRVNGVEVTVREVGAAGRRPNR